MNPARPTSPNDSDGRDLSSVRHKPPVRQATILTTNFASCRSAEQSAQRATLEVAGGGLTAKRPITTAFRPIQYLGNKSRLTSEIVGILTDAIPSGVRVGDLFSGTSVVGRALKSRHPITAVDVQAFAAILGHAMLTGHPADVEEGLTPDFRASFEEAAGLLVAQFTPLIDLEHHAMVDAFNGDVLLLASLIDGGSTAAYRQCCAVSNGRLVAALRSVMRAVGGKTENATASYYFGGVYFSYVQAVHLDAIATAIDRAPAKSQHILRAALLSTCSEIVNTVGKQFAQPMRILKDGKVPHSLLVRRTIRDRSYDVFTIFQHHLRRWRSSLSDCRLKHTVVQGDVLAFLDVDDQCEAFYADPPYTIDHYSRFYHVLETIVLRDAPVLAEMKKGGRERVMRGVYRANRHQSLFCVPSTAPKAFEQLFYKIGRRGAPLLLSYSGYDDPHGERPRLLLLHELQSIARQFFRRVEIITPSFEGYRRLNMANTNNTVKRDTERLILCWG